MTFSGLRSNSTNDDGASTLARGKRASGRFASTSKLGQGACSFADKSIQADPPVLESTGRKAGLRIPFLVSVQEGKGLADLDSSATTTSSEGSISGNQSSYGTAADSCTWTATSSFGGTSSGRRRLWSFGTAKCIGLGSGSSKSQGKIQRNCTFTDAFTAVQTQHEKEAPSSNRNVVSDGSNRRLSGSVAAHGSKGFAESAVISENQQRSTCGGDAAITSRSESTTVLTKGRQSYPTSGGGFGVTVNRADVIGRKLGGDIEGQGLADRNPVMHLPESDAGPSEGQSATLVSSALSQGSSQCSSQGAPEDVTSAGSPMSKRTKNECRRRHRFGSEDFVTSMRRLGLVRGGSGKESAKEKEKEKGRERERKEDKAAGCAPSQGEDSSCTSSSSKKGGKMSQPLLKKLAHYACLCHSTSNCAASSLFKDASLRQTIQESVSTKKNFETADVARNNSQELTSSKDIQRRKGSADNLKERTLSFITKGKSARSSQSPCGSSAQVTPVEVPAAADAVENSMAPLYSRPVEATGAVLNGAPEPASSEEPSRMAVNSAQKGNQVFVHNSVTSGAVSGAAKRQLSEEEPPEQQFMTPGDPKGACWSDVIGWGGNKSSGKTWQFTVSDALACRKVINEYNRATSAGNTVRGSPFEYLYVQLARESNLADTVVNVLTPTSQPLLGNVFQSVNQYVRLSRSITRVSRLSAKIFSAKRKAATQLPAARGLSDEPCDSACWMEVLLFLKAMLAQQRQRRERFRQLRKLQRSRVQQEPFLKQRPQPCGPAEKVQKTYVPIAGMADDTSEDLSTDAGSSSTTARESINTLQRHTSFGADVSNERSATSHSDQAKDEAGSTYTEEHDMRVCFWVLLTAFYLEYAVHRNVAKRRSDIQKKASQLGSQRTDSAVLLDYEMGKSIKRFCFHNVPKPALASQARRASLGPSTATPVNPCRFKTLLGSKSLFCAPPTGSARPYASACAASKWAAWGSSLQEPTDPSRGVLPTYACSRTRFGMLQSVLNEASGSMTARPGGLPYDTHTSERCGHATRTLTDLEQATDEDEEQFYGDNLWASVQKIHRFLLYAFCAWSWIEDEALTSGQLVDIINHCWLCMTLFALEGFAVASEEAATACRKLGTCAASARVSDWYAVTPTSDLAVPQNQPSQLQHCWSSVNTCLRTCIARKQAFLHHLCGGAPAEEPRGVTPLTSKASESVVGQTGRFTASKCQRDEAPLLDTLPAGAQIRRTNHHVKDCEYYRRQLEALRSNVAKVELFENEVFGIMNLLQFRLPLDFEDLRDCAARIESHMRAESCCRRLV